MQVALRAAHVDLEVDEAAEAVADRRDAAVEHRRVGDDDDVGGEVVLVRLDEVVEVGRADLFFPLEDDLHVDRQPAVLLQVRFNRLEVHEDLPLVVGRAARVDFAVADGRLEGRGFPQLDRVDRLHVVVAVEEDGRRARRAQPVAVDDREAGRVDQLDVLQPDAAHLLRRPVRAALHVGRVLRQRADAGDGEVLLELVDVVVAVRIDEVDDVVHNCLILSRAEAEIRD